jgi:TetR/AcrR family transcriptional regulator, cholesterol catabolism regulator
LYRVINDASQFAGEEERFVTELEQSRRERKKGETRDRIFEAAIRLFRERGFEKTTVDAIVEVADVAKGTFFNYFPRKEAVLAYLSERRLEEVEADLAGALAHAKPARDRLIAIFTSAASAYEGDRELSGYVFKELMSRAFQPTEDVSLRWQRLCLEVIEEGRASGELRRDVDPARAESLLASVYIATVYLWLECPELGYDLRTEVRERLELVLDGLATKET